MPNNDNDIRKAANAEMFEMNNIISAMQRDDIKRSCAVTFEMYKGYLDAGFDKHQALALVIAIMQAGVKNQNNGSNKK